MGVAIAPLAALVDGQPYDRVRHPSKARKATSENDLREKRVVAAQALQPAATRRRPVSRQIAANAALGVAKTVSSED